MDEPAVGCLSDGKEDGYACDRSARSRPGFERLQTCHFEIPFLFDDVHLRKALLLSDDSKTAYLDRPLEDSHDAVGVASRNHPDWRHRSEATCRISPSKDDPSPVEVIYEAER